MTSYKLEMRFVSNATREEMLDILENISADMGLKVRKQTLTEVQARGRRSAFTQKIDYFMAKRSKPFSAKLFADYVGLTPAAAWRRLDRLVAAGHVIKEQQDDGTMLYTSRMVDRPDNQVGE